ncbi:hypothetical protein FUAX_04770 [Fulvitalea axinellae]|uniref:L,D-TPase catalytic domain-containing protein n=1 Tax=Fulvitalea axinellae TaxID=1182444 RepID=A0AAU9CFH7_9BACT|nr:hypothetical protein FUAX_04770 [Fulvitalea axinellae]
MRSVKLFLLPVFILLLSSAFAQSDFKNAQLKYPRVRKAYQEAGPNVTDLITAKNIDSKKLRIYLRAFKTEKKIELWGKNAEDKRYKLITTYKVCRTSGELGPKRRQGDYQIPEGYYHIDRFNPYSSYHLSLGINYPNRSDKILSDKNRPGDNIFIHGACVTIGCLPITDEYIRELYVFCVEARNAGQKTIPVTIFPTELTDEKFKKLTARYSNDSDKTNIWTDLKKGYDIFNREKRLPSIGFLKNGRHLVR